MGKLQGQKILLGVAAIAAVIGWAAAAVVMVQSGDLKKQVAQSEAAAADLDEKLAKAQDDLKKFRKAAGTLERAAERVESTKAEQEALVQQIEAQKSELRALSEKLDAGNAELAAQGEQVEAGKTEMTGLTQEIESAQAKLQQLRAEVAQQQATATKARDTVTQSAPKKSAAAPSGSSSGTAASTGEQRLAKARQRFDALDENGDGKIDAREFRVNKVAALQLLDVNRDGYITPDETLLPPAAFKRLDLDGDGKISQLEFVDVDFVGLMDTAGDGFVSFEEYMQFISPSPS